MLYAANTERMVALSVAMVSFPGGSHIRREGYSARRNF